MGRRRRRRIYSSMILFQGMIVNLPGLLCQPERERETERELH
jgi:hypothetical protein